MTGRSFGLLTVNHSVNHLLEVQPVLLTISYKRSKLTREDVIMYHQQEAFVELESTWELLHDLPHALDKLREHRGGFFSVH